MAHLRRAKIVLDNAGKSIDPTNRGAMYVCVGTVFEELGHWDDARRAYENAVVLLEDCDPDRFSALLSLAVGLREKEPAEALRLARFLPAAANCLPTASFMCASLRLAAAQLLTELELEHGNVPDPGHLRDAVALVQQKFPEFPIPSEILELVCQLDSNDPVQG
jgi:hypothetical protein